MSTRYAKRPNEYASSVPVPSSAAARPRRGDTRGCGSSAALPPPITHATSAVPVQAPVAVTVRVPAPPVDEKDAAVGLTAKRHD